MASQLPGARRFTSDGVINLLWPPQLHHFSTGSIT